MVLGRMVYCLHLFKNLTYVKRDVIKNMFTKSIWRMLPNLAGFSDPLNWNTYLLLKVWCPSNALPCLHFCILSKSTLHKVYQTNQNTSGHVCQLTPPPPPPPPPTTTTTTTTTTKNTNSCRDLFSTALEFPVSLELTDSAKPQKLQRQVLGFPKPESFFP